MSFAQKILFDSDRPKYLWWHKTRQNDVVGIVTFDLIIFFPPITLLFIWHDNGISECMRKCSMLTGQLLKQCKIFEISLLESWFFRRNGKLWRLSWRYSPKSGVSWTKRGSWQHCSLFNYLVYKLRTNLCVSLTHCERERNNSNWWRKLMRRSQRYKKCWDNRNKDKRIITGRPHTVCLCNRLNCNSTVNVLDYIYHLLHL